MLLILESSTREAIKYIIMQFDDNEDNIREVGQTYALLYKLKKNNIFHIKEDLTHLIVTMLQS